MASTEEKNDIQIRCPHGCFQETIRFGGGYVLVLCRECYYELESSFVTGFMYRTISLGIQEGMRHSPIALNRK